MKYVPNDKTEQNSRKRTKQTGDKQYTKHRVQILVLKMLSKLNENINNIKKDQSEMKDTLAEMKNNLRESTVE